MRRCDNGSFNHRPTDVRCLCSGCCDCRANGSVIFTKLCHSVSKGRSSAEKAATETALRTLLRGNDEGHVTVEVPGEDSPPGFGPLSDYKPSDRRCVRVDLGVCAVYHGTHFQCFQVEFRRLAVYFPSLFSEELKTRMGGQRVPAM